MFAAPGANRYEAAARKSLAKTGLKQVEGITRVTLKIGENIFGMSNPDVAHLPGSDLYVVFGQPAQDGIMSRLGKNPDAMAAMSNMGSNPMGDMTSMMGGMDAMNFGGEAPAEEEEGEVDEEGLDAEEIESIMAQVGCSRAKAAKTLRKTGTLVDAVIELSSL